jgi:putative hydrolase of the HAD superfamily
VIDIVFFDAGETILHAHPSFPELFAATCERRGHHVRVDQVEPVLFAMVRNMDRVAEEAGVRGPSLSDDASYRFWTHVYRQALGRLGIDDGTLPDELYKVMSDTATYRLYDDALPAIDRLRQSGRRLGLISNFEGWLEELLLELEVGDVFDVSVISALVGVEKPDARIYELALERAGVPAARALMVGDSLRLDVEPARSVGMKAVLLDRAVKYSNLDCPTVATLEELPALVENM